MNYSEVSSLKESLANQIDGLRSVACEFASGVANLSRVVLVGSCARGQATYRSDIDLWFMLGKGPLKFDLVQNLRSEFETVAERLGVSVVNPLRVEIQVLLDKPPLELDEAISESLAEGISIWEQTR